MSKYQDFELGGGMSFHILSTGDESNARKFQVLYEHFQFKHVHILRNEWLESPKMGILKRRISRSNENCEFSKRGYNYSVRHPACYAENFEKKNYLLLVGEVYAYSNILETLQG